VKGWFPFALGLLALTLGALWTLQGLGHLDGSVLTGHRLWAIVGPILALAGMLLIVTGLRIRARR